MPGFATLGQRSRKFIWLAAGVAVLATGAYLVLPQNEGDAATKAQPAAPRAVPVAVATVEEQNLIPWQAYSGRLEAVEKVEVRSRVAGQVQAVHFREGGLVKKGDPLVTIDPAPFQAEVERAQAQVASARARLGYTKHEFERAKKLIGSGAMPVREKDSRANDYHEAQASFRAAEAALTIAKLNLGYTEIAAPVSGRVGRALVTVGNLVAAGANAPVLTTLVSVDPIYASFDADESTVMQALKGVEVDADKVRHVERIPVKMANPFGDGTSIDGHVQMIANVVDAGTGTVRVRAQFGNPNGTLMPGQFARISLGRAKPEPTLLITERAVGSDQDKKYVLVVGKDDKAVYRKITLGRTVGRLRAVTSGLKAGERIVVSGLQRVRPGALVKPTDVAMTPDGGDAVAER